MIMPQGLGFPARATALRDERAFLLAPPLPLGLLEPLLFVPLAMPVSDLVSYTEDRLQRPSVRNGGVGSASGTLHGCRVRSRRGRIERRRGGRGGPTPGGFAPGA